MKFERSDVIPLFPSLEWRLRLDAESSRQISQSVVRKADELMGRLHDDHPAEFMQSQQDLHRDPDLRALASIRAASRVGGDRRARR